MYKIFNLLGDRSSSTYYRNMLPTLHCRDELAKSGIILDMSESLKEAVEYDCYIFSRCPKQKALPLFHTLYEAKRKIIWDMDDELWNIPESNPSHPEFDENMMLFLRMYLHMSNAVTVTNEHLAKSIVDKFKIPRDRITILENLIDFNQYPAISGRSTHVPATKVMWTGGDSHSQDLETIKKLYMDYRDDKSIMFIMHGYLPKYMQDDVKGRVTFIPWGPRHYYEQILALVAPDIALIPLDDTQFNRCKSAIKYYEMSMAGAACVVSAVEPYIPIVGDRVYLARDDRDWDYFLNDLINDKTYREKLNSRAILDIYQNRSWNQSNLARENWLDFFKSIPDMK